MVWHRTYVTRPPFFCAERRAAGMLGIAAARIGQNGRQLRPRSRSTVQKIEGRVCQQIPAVYGIRFFGASLSLDGRLPPTAVWLESSLSTRRFIVAMIIS